MLLDVYTKEELQKYYDLKQGKIEESIDKLKDTDIYNFKINKYAKTTEVFDRFIISRKKFLCLKNMFALRYVYNQKTYIWGFETVDKAKTVCWIDLLVKPDDYSFFKDDHKGVTITELKILSGYDLNYIQGQHYLIKNHYYVKQLYEELKSVEEEFLTAMENDESFPTYDIAFSKPIFLRAQDTKYVQYGKTEKYIIVGARIRGCDSPERICED